MLFKTIKNEVFYKMNKIKQLEKNRFSILTNDLTTCYLCGRPKNHLHEIFFGKNRINSMIYGCVAPLCFYCHEKVHKNEQLNIMLKEKCQKKFIETYPDKDFLSIFHKNYI